MSDGRQETIADIMAEMRTFADSMEKHLLYDLRECATDYLRVLADRIEAADHRFREVAKMIPHEEVAAAKIETTTPTAEKSSVVGNAEKCRRANSKPMTLDKAIANAEEVVDETPCGQEHSQLAEWLRELREIKNSNVAAMREAVDKLLNFLRWEYAQDYPAPRDKLADAIDIGVAALSTPPRNCDVGTAEEQARRYEELCDSHTCGSICSGSGCPLYDYDCSPFAWAQMPYEALGQEKL